MSALSRKKELRIVGIMNGTSLDGIDYVYCRIRKSLRPQVHFLGHVHVSFPKEIQTQLEHAANHRLNVEDLAKLHHELGRMYQSQLKKILSRKKWRIDAIGLHGQTVYHAPPAGTLQIGEPSYLSAHFQVPVVSDFRAADLAVGGQAAPLATLFHQVVFHSMFKKQSISVHNLGGMSNLSYMDAKGRVQKAFDTGPANMLIDLFISKISQGDLRYDEDGKFAAKGLPLQHLVEKWVLDHPFLQIKPPKSCGREQFGESFMNQMEQAMGSVLPEDKIATFTEFTAASIAHAYLEFCPDIPKVIVLCGGGALNSYLRKRIQYRLPSAKVLTTLDLGWPVDSVEGAAFALLAAYRVWNIHSNLPKTTNARKAVTLGKVTEAF